MVRWILSAALLVASLAPWASHAQTLPSFTVSEPYLHALAEGNSILVSVPVRLTHRTASVHALAKDCEMHIAGKPNGLSLGTPESVVVEPPYLCKFKHSSNRTWPTIFDQSVIDKDCVATGFPRIFSEHVAGGSEAGANPNHVFELHPATKIVCGAQTLAFDGYLRWFKGMRVIKPESADDCIRTRALSGRFDPAGHRYEFTEDSGANCGNFAIVQVAYIEPNWVRTLSDGHSAVARVSLNGGSNTTLKLYTIAGTDADAWLERVRTGAQGDDRIYLHGMISYDYFAMVRTMRAPDGAWLNPTQWTKVDFPLALVVMGMPESAPWPDED